MTRPSLYRSLSSQRTLRQRKKRWWFEAICMILITVALMVGAAFSLTNKDPANEGLHKHNLKKKHTVNVLTDLEHAVTPYINFSSPSEQALLEGDYFLYNIKLKDSSLTNRSEDKSYTNVQGFFCPVNWTRYAEDPAAVAFYSHLGTYECEQQRIIWDLQDIVQKARLFDAAPASSVRVLPIGGAVFHESRVGSTLVSNLLTTIGRVYSEPFPLSAAMTACASFSGDFMPECDAAKQQSLVEDIFYLLQRSRKERKGEEQRIFFKFSSGLTTSITQFTQLFPRVPWIFLYRDSVEVLASHQKQSSCHRRLQFAQEIKQDIAMRSTNTSLGVSVWDSFGIDFCAAQLAGICEAALEHLPYNGRLVNYDQLPSEIWNEVLPNHFGIPVANEERERMVILSGRYSKRTENPVADKEWKVAETQQKNAASTPELRYAAMTFMQPTFEKLEKARQWRRRGWASQLFSMAS